VRKPLPFFKERIVFEKLLYIAVAGAAGTLARYGIAGAVQRTSGSLFPFGTAAVNLIGCFLAGVLWTLAENRINMSVELRATVFVGFMGAFTTFSTFVLETGAMIRNGEWFWAFGNVAFQTIAGLALFFLGAALARLI